MAEDWLARVVVAEFGGGDEAVKADAACGRQASLPHSKVRVSRRRRIGLFQDGRLWLCASLPIWFSARSRGCTRWLRGRGCVPNGREGRAHWCPVATASLLH